MRLAHYLAADLICSWDARAGLREPDRIVAVCADLGISPERAHNLGRQLALPDPIRTRVAERPAGEQISMTMANRLADMHEIAPQLTDAVAKRITSTDLHDKALRDLGAFVHRTVVEDEHTYAVRIDDGAMLDAAEQIDSRRDAPKRPRSGGRSPRSSAASPSGSTRELDALAARAKPQGAEDPDHLRGPRPRPQRPLRLRPRSRAGLRRRHLGHRPGLHDRPRPRAAPGRGHAPAREEAYFAGARIDDDELRDAGAEDEQRRAQARARHAEATRSNLGLGHDIRAGLIQPRRRPAPRRSGTSSAGCSSATTAS